MSKENKKQTIIEDDQLIFADEDDSDLVFIDENDELIVT